MSRIAIITGSTRPGRRSPSVAQWVLEQADGRVDATFTIVDLADFDLPHLNEPVPAAMGPNYVHAGTRTWSDTIASFDGFVFVTPEYNHSMPGVLKDAVDYLYDEWSNKAAGFVSYGIDGGVRAVEQMRLVMAEVGIADVRHQVALSLFHDFSGEVPQPNDHAIATLSVMLDEVVAWSLALAPLRSVEVPA